MKSRLEGLQPVVYLRRRDMISVYWGELFALTERAELYQVLLWVIAAIAVTLAWEPQTLTQGRKSPGADETDASR